MAETVVHHVYEQTFYYHLNCLIHRILVPTAFLRCSILLCVSNCCKRANFEIWWCSSSGELYEFDRKSKPAWKKHIWSETSMEEISLAPSTGSALYGISGSHSRSLFLLTKVCSRYASDYLLHDTTTINLQITNTKTRRNNFA